MEFIGTRDETVRKNFEEVLTGTLDPKGGLFLPKEFPHFSENDIRAMRGLSYEDVAFRVMRPFLDQGFIFDKKLQYLIKESYRNFSDEERAPLKTLTENLSVQELHHGPTLAFKDYALQPVARLIDHSLQRSNNFMNVLLATSGDTGAAAIWAFKDCDHIAVFVLYPDGRISNIQEPFMTTVQAEDVYALAVEQSTFDDCQSMVKTCFNDPAFSKEYRLGAANSINLARIVGQIPYYFYAALQRGVFENNISFVVPTGNFGDALAGHYARAMGLPIHKIVIATNSNDILHRFVETGAMTTARVTPTSSPSMDIQISSNFERLLFESLGGDRDTLTKHMQALKKNGSFTVEKGAWAFIRNGFASGRADEALTGQTIKKTYENYNYLIDPHTATGMATAWRIVKEGKFNTGEPLGKDEQIVSLATASPAKFPHVVRDWTGITPQLPLGLRDLPTRPNVCKHPVGNNLEAIRAFVRAHAFTV
ncbi:MAG: threonine synthase [Alphaproteobacteria bacterium]|nr:threonine synthase [Alphaproteobacteria bacterium]